MAYRSTLTSLQVRTPLHVRIVFGVFAAWFTGIAGYILFRSLHWPTVHDGPILLYMVFLSEHGMRLYRDIVEVQFPGALLLYSFERHVFGSSELGFRIFDLFGLAAGLAAMFVIVRRSGYWFAAVFGFAFFLFTHTSNGGGIRSLGERDFFVACFIAIGVAFLLESSRQQKAVLAIGFGLAVALSATIKPTSGLFVLAVLPVLKYLREQRRSISPYVAWIFAGVAAGVALVLCYLLHKNAFWAFLAIERTMMPLYYPMANQSVLRMIHGLNEPLLFPLLFGAAILLALLQPRLLRMLEQQVLLVSAAAGLICYLVQHKGFFYHRAPFFFFAFFWAGWVFVFTIQEGNRIFQWIAVALLLISAIQYQRIMRQEHWDGWNETMLQNDLNSIHAFDKPGEVQCLDETGGCTTVAVRKQMVMATGYVTDYLFFLNSDDPRLDSMRAEFLKKLKRANPRVIVMTNDQWPTLDHDGYDRLNIWPQMRDFLAGGYSLSVERGGDANHHRGYRIYTRKD